MDKPLVRKNLPALAEQMQNVAGQLRSVAASAELFKMVARTRNIISNTLYPLEKRKVMALGVVPWQGAWCRGRGRGRRGGDGRGLLLVRVRVIEKALKGVFGRKISEE